MRELKIALIVGFSAVLFVAILLSDHFAKVHKAPLIDPGTATPTLFGIAPSDPIKTPEDRVLDNESLLAKGAGRESVEQQMARKQAQREERALEGGPLVIDTSASKGSPVGNVASAINSAAQRVINGTSPAALNTSTAADPHQDITKQIKDAGGNVTDVAGHKDFTLPGNQIASKPDAAKPDPTKPEAGKPEIGKTETASNTPAKPAAPGVEPVKHLVANGESLYDISKKYYGNGSQWKKIADANPGRVAANGSVRTGVQLLIPNAPAPKTAEAKPSIAKDQTKTAPTTSEPKPKPLGSGETRITLDQKAKKAEPAKSDPAKTEAKPDLKANPKGNVDPKVDPKKDIKVATDTKAKRPVTYTVRAGDTAGKISQQMLGTSKRAEEILELNNLQEESLRVGMVLKLPSA